MKRNQYIKYTFTVCILAIVCAFLGCKKDDSDNSKYTNGYTGNDKTTTVPTSGSQGGNIVITPTTTLPAPEFELPTLTADNIEIEAGQSIDYIANLKIDGAGETDISEINVNTSTVRTQVPGLYKAVYTVIFRGYPVTKTIVVNVTAPKDSTVPTFAETPSGDSVGNMAVELSSGEICQIPCTTEHFIIETKSVDTFSKVNGDTYRTSVLRATFSDGEVIDLETVYTRAVEN